MTRAITQFRQQCSECGRRATVIGCQQWACYHCGRIHSVDMAQHRRLARNEARRERAACYRELGLIKVRGALGGAYYE